MNITLPEDKRSNLYRCITLIQKLYPKGAKVPLRDFRISLTVLGSERNRLNIYIALLEAWNIIEVDQNNMVTVQKIELQ